MLWGSSLVGLQEAGEPGRAPGLSSRGLRGGVAGDGWFLCCWSRPGRDSGWTRNEDGKLRLGCRLDAASKVHVEPLGWRWSGAWTEFSRVGAARGLGPGPSLLTATTCKSIAPWRACLFVIGGHPEFHARCGSPEVRLPEGRPLLAGSADLFRT